MILQAYANRGTVHFILYDLELTGPLPTGFRIERDLGMELLPPFWERVAPFTPSQRRERYLMGFGYTDDRRTVPPAITSTFDLRGVWMLERWRTASSPLWPAVLAFGLLPAHRAWQSGRCGRRRRRGLCPQCGYDLRASREQCPECGRADRSDGGEGMTRRRMSPTVAGLSLLLCVLAVVLWLRGREDSYRRKPGTDPVSVAIAGRLPMSGEGVIDLGGIASFDWDRVYFFGPYTTQAEVERRLGFAWQGLGGSAIESSDRVTLVVFVKDGRVVRSFDHPRNLGDFSGEPTRPERFTKAQARFVVRREGAEGWPVVRVEGTTTAPTTGATAPTEAGSGN